MFFITSKLLAFLIKPIIWIFILIIIAIIFKTKRKKILTYTIIIFWIFSNGFLADEAARAWEIKKEGTLKITDQYEVGIILGGFSGYDPEIKMLDFNAQSDRMIFAEQLYYQGKIKKILISGGNGTLINNNYREAKEIKNHLIRNKIPEEDIWIENTSRNTYENASNSAKILKEKGVNSILLITSAIHMRRSLFCFEKANIRPTPFSTDYTSKTRKFNLEYMLIPSMEGFIKWQDLIHEYIGYIVYRIKL